MKPRFSDRQLRFDPILASEDTNGLYRAIRGLRELRGTREASSSSPAARAGQVGERLLARLAAWVALQLVELRVLGIQVIRPSVRRMVRDAAGSHGAPTTMPDRIGAVFGPRGFSRDAAIALWMTGASGWEVIEACYLEEKEPRPAWLVTGFLLRLIVAAGLLRSAAWTGPYAYPAGWMLAILAGLVLFRVIKPAWGTDWELMDSTVIGWMQAAKYTRLLTTEAASDRGARARIWLMREAYRETFRSIVALVLAGLYAVLIATGLYSLHLFLWSGPDEEQIYGMLAHIAICVCFGFILGAVFSIDQTPRERERAGADMKMRANFGFALYMTVVVMDDPDGERWAIRTFPTGYKASIERERRKRAW